MIYSLAVYFDLVFVLFKYIELLIIQAKIVAVSLVISVGWRLSVSDIMRLLCCVSCMPRKICHGNSEEVETIVNAGNNLSFMWINGKESKKVIEVFAVRFPE